MFTDATTSIATITKFINQTIYVIIGVAVLIFVFGLLKYIRAGGDSDTIKEARDSIIMGIVIIFVMTCVWGLVRVISNTIMLSNTTPSSDEIPQVPGAKNIDGVDGSHNNTVS